MTTNTQGSNSPYCVCYENGLPIFLLSTIWPHNDCTLCNVVMREDTLSIHWHRVSIWVVSISCFACFHVGSKRFSLRSDGPKRRQQFLWHEMKSLSPIWPIASYNDLCEGRSIFYINTYLEACHPQDDYHICKSFLIFILLLNFWGWLITCCIAWFVNHAFDLNCSIYVQPDKTSPKKSAPIVLVASFIHQWQTCT